jgi:hypothetical protein
MFLIRERKKGRDEKFCEKGRLRRGREVLWKGTGRFVKSVCLKAKEGTGRFMKG